MKRSVTSHLDLGLSAPARLVFAIAGAQGSPFASESLALSVDDHEPECRAALEHLFGPVPVTVAPLGDGETVTYTSDL